MRAVLCAVLIACGAPVAPTTPSVANRDRDFDSVVDRFLTGYYAFRPSFAIEQGLHDYDGKVPDRSAAAITAEIRRLHEARDQFTAFPEAGLSAAKQLDKQIVLAEIAKELFDLETRRKPFRDPFFYLFKFSLNAYIARDYAPAAKRAAAMLTACEAAPAYYRDAATNLEPNLPRVWLQVGLMIGGGTVQFLDGDAKKAFAELPDRVLRDKLTACLGTLALEVGKFGEGLKARMPAATDDFRLGADGLVQLLREVEGLDLDLATLERVARADLERNRAAIAEAARAIDPSRDAAVVIAEVGDDKPAPDRVLDEATAQLAQLEKFLVDKHIVSLPRKDRVEVRASPSFLRGNFAALGGVGPFERANLPSYYYIAPPDPAWPADQQRAYLMSKPDLLFTSAHEVYPGHFVQGMHQRASGSLVLPVFETYTASEGWAHYVEEMVWEQGLGDRDPRVHIGQLKNALLRDVRFAVALGYHAGTMTVEQATKLFIEQAFADPKTAMQQALRGTVDPMFLGYTLGKLIIMELRADWQRANPSKSLREFHDTFLGYGEAPLAVTRRMMLGPAAHPPLR